MEISLFSTIAKTFSPFFGSISDMPVNLEKAGRTANCEVK
jgi:hypothetical protein